MKSRTSLFNGTVLKKDMVRFCPVWIIYTVLHVMITLSTISIDFEDVLNYIPQNFAFNLTSMVGVTFAYALLCALLLFGDLFKSRLCNALHALPLRRESWFATHALAALLFFLIPTLSMVLIFLPFLGELWFMAPLWLLAVTVMFLFFFGLASLCIMLTGSRFAATAVYFMINYFSMLCYWLLDTYYLPLLPGLHIKTDFFSWFCPTLMLSNFEYFRFDEVLIPKAGFPVGVWKYTYHGLSDGWLYIGILAALAVVFFALALVLYRKRKLESAGDFLAFRKTRPVFMVIFALAVGAVFHSFFSLFGTGIISMAIGTVIGCYAGQMLLRRSVKVFDKRSAIWCGILAGSLVVTLIVTAIDPLGLTRWTPDPDKVASITISNDYEFGLQDPEINFSYFGNYITITNEEDIENLVSIHESIIAKKAYEDKERFLLTSYAKPIHLTYHMADGREVVRRYYVTDEAIYSQLQPYFSTTQFLLGYNDFERFFNDVATVYLDDEPIIPRESVRSLLEAVWADCEAGNMRQDTSYTGQTDHYIQIDTKGYYLYLDIYDYSENTMKWIKQCQATH